MVNAKDFYVEKYKELKSLKNGLKPLRNEFLGYCKIGEKNLLKVFGKDSYSKLQIEAGDEPNKLELQRTSIKQILEDFGSLTRKHQRQIVQADWMEANYSPTPDGISKVHKIKWSEIPKAFSEYFKDNSEWLDVIEILKASKNVSGQTQKGNKVFSDIVEKIVQWIPDRKRIIEEGYKVELRNYLEKFFAVEEETGDSNADLIINGRYPIEIKKDPSQSEYDRLLGQMIRHNKSLGTAIAIITSVSSQDRFKRFQRLFVEVHDKLGMTAELFLK